MPYPFYYGFGYMDAAYIAVIIAAIFSLAMSVRVNSTFKKYSAVVLPSRMTGADAARRVLDAHGLSNVRIERVSGDLTDHLIQGLTSFACQTRYTGHQLPPQ